MCCTVEVEVSGLALLRECSDTLTSSSVELAAPWPGISLSNLTSLNLVARSALTEREADSRHDEELDPQQKQAVII